jgi:hypothetical protein
MRVARGIAVLAIPIALAIDVSEAPATVAEQRSRLPPAAECESEVEGKWKALIWDEDDEWYEFTLEIHHDPDDKTKLTGTITVHSWNGPANEPEPPSKCRGLNYIGKMDGSGSFVDGQVVFGGADFHITEEICGRPGLYNEDQFSGKLEPERQEFQSVNNDGGDAVNEPTVFRRIGCFDQPQDKPNPASGDIKPPSFYPKKRRSSGGC